MDINMFSKRMAKGAVIVFFGMLLSKALAYLYVALVARLGSSEYGLLSLGISIVSFISIFSLLGLNTGIIRYISYYNGKQDDRRIKGTILSSLRLSLPVSLVLMILFQKINYKVLVKEVIEGVIRLVLTFAVIYLGYNLLGTAVVYLISFMMTAFLSFYLLQKKVFPFFKTKVIPIFFTKELFVFSFPFIFAGVLTLIVKWTDVFMIGFFRTTSEVGVYNVALPTANLLVIVPTSLMALFMPIITEFYSKGKIKDIVTLSRINSKWIFFLNFPIFLLIFLFSKNILEIMFGSEYVTGNTALLVLTVGYMVFSLVHIPNAILIMMKKTKLIFY